jgi:hypothetical protein
MGWDKKDTLIRGSGWFVEEKEKKKKIFLLSSLSF